MSNVHIPESRWFSYKEGALHGEDVPLESIATDVGTPAFVYSGAAIDEERIEAAFQAYEDIGIRSLTGFAMMGKPIIDNFPFVEALVPPALAAELRAAPRPTGAAQLALDLAMAPAWASPELRAAASPRLRSWVMTRTRSPNDAITSPVPSSEPSSTTMISWASSSWARTDSMDAARKRSER